MKSVLITGCSSGFGLDLVPRFLEGGWKVFATLRNAKERELLFHQVQMRFPDRFKILELDITKNSDRAAVTKVLDLEGRLDCLINNAGYGLYGPLEELSEKQIRDQMEVNFFGLALFTQSLLPVLRKSKGRIINISSAMGFVGLPLSSLYAASKFAVEGLTESLFYELKPHGIQVCLVEPGRFRTSFGKKMIYGETMFDPFSPYFQVSKRFKEWREYRTASEGVSPEAVIDRVFALASQKKMPLRALVGNDSRTAYFLKKLLPSSLFHFIMAAVFNAGLTKSRNDLQSEDFA